MVQTQGEGLRKGTLVKSDGFWFIRTKPRKENEKERLIPLPDDKLPLLVNVCDWRMVSFPGQLDRRGLTDQSEGAIVLYRFRRHERGKVYKIKYWGYCPRSLEMTSEIIQRSTGKPQCCQHRRGPHQLLLRQAG